MEDKLTTELISEVKANGKRWMKAFILILILFFLTNIAWMIAWNLPAEDTTTTEVEQQGDNGNNNYIGNNGDINNGKAKGNNDKNGQEN